MLATARPELRVHVVFLQLLPPSLAQQQFVLRVEEATAGLPDLLERPPQEGIGVQGPLENVEDDWRVLASELVHYLAQELYFHGDCVRLQCQDVQQQKAKLVGVALLQVEAGRTLTFFHKPLLLGRGEILPVRLRRLPLGFLPVPPALRQAAVVAQVLVVDLQVTPLALEPALGRDQQLRGRHLPDQSVLAQQPRGPADRLHDVPNLVFRKGRSPAVPVAYVAAQRVVKILPVFGGVVGRRSFGAGRAGRPAFDLKTIKRDEVWRLYILDLLEEMEQP